MSLHRAIVPGCFPVITLIAAAIPGALTASAGAGVVAVPQFTGAMSETFNEFSNTLAVQSLNVFSNTAQLQNLTPGGAIKVEFSSSLSGDLVVPISGMMAGQLGVAQWHFNTPVTRFGGMWENNSGASNATVDFYDTGDNLLGELVANVPVAAQTWTWNGWQSDVPISRIKVTGNGVVQGFIWYENMQIDPVPTPGGVLLLVTSLLSPRPRRRERQ